MTILIKADSSRRVDLDGVGPVPRPVDIDQTQTGFKRLRTLRVYRFEPPAVVHGHAEEDEVFIVILNGRVDLKIKSDQWSQSSTQWALAAPDSSASVACAAYLPPDAEYELTPRSATDVAYARALPSRTRAPAIFSTAPAQDDDGHQVLLDVPGYAEVLRIRLITFEAQAGAPEFDPNRHSASAREALVHIRTLSKEMTIVDPAGTQRPVDSWDTLAVHAGERPLIRAAPPAAMVSLIVTTP